MNKKQTRPIVIIDSNSVIHRAFHALPELTTKDGKIINALYGFLLVLLKIINDFHPRLLIACFDYPAPTFRHKKFKEYKSQRPPTPKELSLQIPDIKRAVELFNALVLEKKGFEADDLIGTAVQKIKSNRDFSDEKIIIVSGDRDLLQLIDSKVEVYLLRKGVKNADLYNIDLVREKYLGLYPSQLVDLCALKGDVSDNIPGVRGIGQKTAIKLLKEFKCLEGIFEAIKEQGKETVLIAEHTRNLLLDQKGKAVLSKELAIIKKDVPCNFSLGNNFLDDYNPKEVISFFQKMGFKTLIKRLFGEMSKRDAQSNNLRLW